MYGYDLQLLPFCAAKLGLRLIESDCSCSSHTLCRERLYRNFLRRNDSCQWQLQMLHSHLYTSMHIRSFLRGTTIAGCTSSCRCCRRTSSGRKKAWRGEKWWRILGHTLHLHVPPRAVWVGLCWLCIGTSKPVVQYHIMFVVLVHVVLLWHRCSVNPSPLQISFSPPYDMAAIHKHKSERNAFLNSLGHEKWMSRILKITYYVYIACAVDSHWIIICIYIYECIFVFASKKNHPCSLPLATDEWEYGWEQYPRQLRGHASLHCVPGKSRESLVTCAKIS